MKCECYGQHGMETFVVDDDAPPEEIARIAKIIATTEPGNGSGRIFYRQGKEPKDE